MGRKSIVSSAISIGIPGIPSQAFLHFGLLSVISIISKISPLVEAIAYLKRLPFPHKFIVGVASISSPSAISVFRIVLSILVCPSVFISDLSSTLPSPVLSTLSESNIPVHSDDLSVKTE